MFGTGGGDTYACGLVSAKYGLAKNGVIVAGFDMFPQTLGYIHTGDMTFTTDQQPYLQGGAAPDQSGTARPVDTFSRAGSGREPPAV